MSGFDILSLVGEPWIEPASLYRGIGVTIVETGSLPSSKFLEFVLNGASIYSVLKTGETIVSNATGTSLGGFKLAGGAGEMALTSQLDLTTLMPAETLRYAWEDPLHVGNDPLSGAVLQGMGASNFSIESPATITHIAGNSTYAWAGMVGARLLWAGYEAATSNGKTIDFTNVGQATRASPILSVSAGNVADDLIHFGLSDGTSWSVAAKVDAAGRGMFQMLDLPEQGAPGDPAAGSARIYGLSVGGTTKIAFRDSSGAETVLGSTVSISGGTVTANTPVVSFSQTWNSSSTSFSALSATITDTNSTADSTLIKFNVGAGPVYQVRKTGETVISNAAGTSLGGVKLAGAAGEMALTSQTDTATGAPAEVLRYAWKDADHVGSDPASVAVLRGMGATDFSIESPAAISHASGTSSYAWTGVSGDRLAWKGLQTGTATGKTIDFTNVGQAPLRASPIASFSAENPADDLVHFGTSTGTAWTVAAKVDAAGRGQFQMLDVSEQGTPGNPAAASARIYGKSVGGTTKVAFRDSNGAETVLGSTIAVAGGTVTASTPLASFSQTWNATSIAFSAITANITDTQSAPTSTLLSLTVNADPVFQVRKTGELLIHNAAGTRLMTLSGDLDDGATPGRSRGTFHGLVVNWNRTNVGGSVQPQLEMQVEGKTYWQVSPDTRDVSENGGFGPMMRFANKNDPTKYWGIEYESNGGAYTISNGVRMSYCAWDGPPGEVAEYIWTVNNRVSFESRAAFVHISKNGRFEWESGAVGEGASRVLFIGYYSGTAIGATIDFNNFGQTPTRANPVMSISVETAAEDPLHIGRIFSGGWTTLSRFDGNGILYAPSVAIARTTGTQPALAVKLDTDAQNRVSIGLDANDLGVLRFGIGGATAQDLTLSRDIIPGTLGVNNGTSAATIRLYRTYANGGAETEFWNMTWRLITTVPWASIRTGAAGSGQRRNICIEPTLLGIGVPIGDSSNIPALKNVAGTLQIRKGDDSDFAPVKGKLSTHTAAQSATIVPDMVLTLYDANGVAYKVPCVAA